MKNKYEESLEGCKFIFRVEFFEICADQFELVNKCENLTDLAHGVKKRKKDGSIDYRGKSMFCYNFFSNKYALFLPFGKWNEITGRNRLSTFLCSRLSPVNPVFTLPGMRLNWTSRPHQLYQRYMRIYSENLTEEEKQIIEQENLKTDTHQGPEWDCFAEAFWKLLQF